MKVPEPTSKRERLPKRRLFRSLGGQMVLLVSGIILAAMLTNAYFQFRDEVNTMEQVLKVRAQSLGQMLSSISLDALLVYDVVSLNTYIEYLTEQEQVVHAVILDIQDNALTTFMDRSDVYVQTLIESRKDIDSASIVSLLEQNRELVAFRVSVMFNDVLLAKTVLVLDNSEYVAASASKFQDKVLVTVVIGLLVGTAFYFIFTSRVLTPVRRLSDSANRIANYEFGQYLEVQGDNELTDLSDNFNQMSLLQ